ncbi:MAG: hypothetical protein GY862_04635 [Gammaproteobacteria bacterium]|nr:hypothetical protein [Gammaproteobacteria bacterium]
MKDNMLQRFLDEGMLDIGGNDERFKSLQKAADELSENLLKIQPKVISYTLVALEPKISSDEPVLAEVEEAVKQHWKTLRNTHKVTPIQIFRAVIFEALRIASEKDTTTASIVWLTGGSFFSHAELGEAERKLHTEFISATGEIAEGKAVEEWTVAAQEPHLPQWPDWNIKGSDAQLPEVDEKKLTEELAAAAGPTKPGNQPTGPDPNHHWPNTNQQWGWKFAPRAAKGIAGVVNRSFTDLMTHLREDNNLSGISLKEYASAISATIKKTMEQTAHGIEVRERREALLWWKQTLYSPSLRRGYRSLNACQSAWVMAHDLHEQTMPFSPQSVEYLLREAVRETIEPQDATSIALFGFCKELAKEAHDLLKLSGSQEDTPGRMPLLHFIRCILADTLKQEQLHERTGVSGDTKITFAELAVWLFRDLQAERLAGIQ